MPSQLLAVHQRDAVTSPSLKHPSPLRRGPLDGFDKPPFPWWSASDTFVGAQDESPSEGWASQSLQLRKRRTFPGQHARVPPERAPRSSSLDRRRRSSLCDDPDGSWLL